MEELLIACLERMERDGPRALEEVCREAPRSAAELRARVAELERLGLLDRLFERAPPARSTGWVRALLALRWIARKAGEPLRRPV